MSVNDSIFKIEQSLVDHTLQPYWKLNTRIPWKTKLFIIFSNKLTIFLFKKKHTKLLSFLS